MTITQTLKLWQRPEYVGDEPCIGDYSDFDEYAIEREAYHSRKVRHDLAVFLMEENAEMALSVVAIALDRARKAGL